MEAGCIISMIDSSKEQTMTLLSFYRLIIISINSISIRIEYYNKHK